MYIECRILRIRYTCLWENRPNCHTVEFKLKNEIYGNVLYAHEFSFLFWLYMYMSVWLCVNLREGATGDDRTCVYGGCWKRTGNPMKEQQHAESMSFHTRRLSLLCRLFPYTTILTFRCRLPS